MDFVCGCVWMCEDCVSILCGFCMDFAWIDEDLYGLCVGLCGFVWIVSRFCVDLRGF